MSRRLVACHFENAQYSADELLLLVGGVRIEAKIKLDYTMINLY